MRTFQYYTTALEYARAEATWTGRTQALWSDEDAWHVEEFWEGDKSDETSDKGFDLLETHEPPF